MAIIMRGYYTPGRKPEPSLHEKLKCLKMTSYPGREPDCRPLPYVKGSCFSSDEEKNIADKKWRQTYTKNGA